VRWFRERGLWVQGFDGIQINIERCPEGCFLHDLTKQAIRRTVDFVWACEVVEHVHERYMDKLMDTLTSGRVVAITHAWPGQAGFHHVNCQLPEYWIARFEARGYKLNQQLTETCRRIAGPQTHFGRVAEDGSSQGGLIFELIQ
jgi:hypothetical protein